MKRNPLSSDFLHKGIRPPRWLVLEVIGSQPTGRVFAMLSGEKHAGITEAKAHHLAQIISDTLRQPAMVVLERHGYKKNPTLVAHGLKEAASYHVWTHGAGNRPIALADIYTPAIGIARKIAQEYADALHVPVKLAVNSLEPHSFARHEASAMTFRRGVAPVGTEPPPPHFNPMPPVDDDSAHYKIVKRFKTRRGVNVHSVATGLGYPYILGGYIVLGGVVLHAVGKKPGGKPIYVGIDNDTGEAIVAEPQRPHFNPTQLPKAGERWRERISDMRATVTSVGGGRVVVKDELGNRQWIDAQEFGAAWVPVSRRNPTGRDARTEFSVGDPVSISAIQYFGRHGTVEKVTKQYVWVRDNLSNKLVKFHPDHLRVTNARGTSNPKPPAVGERRQAERLKTLKPRRLYRAQRIGARKKAGHYLASFIQRQMKRANPRTRPQLERAHDTFRKWHEFDSKRVTRVKGPARKIPGTLVKLGDIEQIVYRSPKYTGKQTLYEHTTKRPRPVLATDPDGRFVYVVGGKMRVTADGLVN